MARTVLLIEDEPDLAEVIRYNLERDGMTVHWVASGEEGLARARSHPADLILLDIMLPELDGLTVCRRLKSSPDTELIPIIITSAKGEEADVVAGLELGADDYLAKPFSPRVLVARIRAVLRRYEKAEPQPESDATTTLADVVLDRSRYAATAASRSLELTKTEFELFYFLAQRPGRVFTRSQLLDAVQGEASFVSDRTVDVHIAALRKKLGTRAHLIQTIRGIGYRCEERA